MDNKTKKLAVSIARAKFLLGGEAAVNLVAKQVAKQLPKTERAQFLAKAEVRS